MSTAHPRMTEQQFQQTVTSSSLRYSSSQMMRYAKRQAEKYQRAAQQLAFMATLVDESAEHLLVGQSWLEAAELILDKDA